MPPSTQFAVAAAFQVTKAAMHRRGLALGACILGNHGKGRFLVGKLEVNYLVGPNWSPGTANSAKTFGQNHRN